MRDSGKAVLTFLAALSLLGAQEKQPAGTPQAPPPEPTEIVFRSDVALVRVDTQVVDRQNRAITGLRRQDFVLRESGKVQEIRNFASEEMPVDVLLLLDVSVSMRSHVQRVAEASTVALRVLGDDDRVAIMVFDRGTRLRLPFRKNREDVEREFERLLRQEDFDGGTDIRRGMDDAIRYIARNGRRDARRAIVIVTDDQTERGRDVEGTLRQLEANNIVLSSILAPDVIGSARGRSYPSGGGGYPPRRRGGIGWPGGGGGWGWPGDPGGSWPGGGGGGVYGSRTQSAGSREIAERSGGDAMEIYAPEVLETMLARIRQRYALHFLLPDGVAAGSERIDVQLSEQARRRYPDARLRFRRAVSSGLPSDAEPVVISQSPADSDPDPAPASESTAQKPRRRVAVNDGSGSSRGPVIATESGSGTATSSPATSPAATQSAPAAQETTSPATGGGWRRVKPGEKP